MTEDPHDDVRELVGIHPGKDGEVSAVTGGANPGADILLLKRIANGTDEHAIVLASGHGDGSDHEEASVPKGNETAAPGGAAPRQEILLKLDAEQRQEIESIMKAAVEKATAPMQAKIDEQATQLAALKAEAAKNEELEAFAAGLPEGMRAAFMALTPEEQAAFMEQNVAMAAGGALSPLAKIAKSFEDLAKRNSAQEIQLAKLRDDQEQAKAVAKFAPLEKAIKVEDFARHYRTIAKVSPEAAEYVAQTVSALAERQKMAGLFSVRGADGGWDDKSAVAKVYSMAEERIRKSASTLSRASALDQVLSENPELYKAYEQERNG